MVIVVFIFELMLLVLLGTGIGAFGTIIGAGGGFLLVPILLIFYGMDSKVAAGTSLFFVFLTALSGTFAYIRQKRVDLKIGSIFTIMTIPGSIIGAYITTYILVGNIFKMLFSFLLVLSSLYLIIRPVKENVNSINTTYRGYYRKVVDSNGKVYEYKVPLTRGVIISFGVGFISSMFGIGGGIIHVPAMIFLLNFPVHIATATSYFVLLFSSLTGSVTHFFLGNVEYIYSIPLGFGALIGAQVGARISSIVRGTLIERLLGLALIIVAIRLLLQ